MLLGGIKRLLHFEDHTIKAVRGLLKEKGVQHVMDLSPDLNTPVVSPIPNEAPTEVAEIDQMVEETSAQLQAERKRVEGELLSAEDEIRVFLTENTIRDFASERATAQALFSAITNELYSVSAEASAVNGQLDRTRAQLAFLSPKFQAAILDGTQPPELTLKRLVSVTHPLDWSEQERLFGF